MKTGNGRTLTHSGMRTQLIGVLIALVIGALLYGCNPVSTPSTNTVDQSAAADIQSPVPDVPTMTSTPAAADSPLDAEDAVSAGELEPAVRVGMYDAPPEMTIDTDKYYYATIRTEKGDMMVQLFADRAPQTVNNFVFLAEEGFYDDTTFHRVIDGFMAQAGDPAATGAGGPGYTFEDEIYPGLVFDQPGLLAMANRGPATNGSQFFITFGPTEWLDGGHTIFGKVIEGMEVLDQITRVDPQADASMVGDAIYGIDIEVTDESILPTPTPAPPTPTPTSTPTPFAPTDLDTSDSPLAEMEPAARANYFNTAPEVVIDTEKTYQAEIATSQGTLIVDLFAESAPVAVNNFVVLAELGFFDGVPINLVRPEDSLVFGSPDNLETSDAGYAIPAELNADTEMAIGILTNLPIAESQEDVVPSSSSQILVALIEPPAEFAGLLGFFGQIVEGLDVLSELTMDDTIESVTISIGE